MQVPLYGELLIILLIIEPCVFLTKNVSDYTLFDSDTDSDGAKTSSNLSTNTEEGNHNEVLNTCTEPGYIKMCSGHGTCRNSTCVCDSLGSQENSTESLYEYTGKYCEECPYCKGQRCDKLLPCVEYILKNSKNHSSCHIYYKLVQSLKVDYTDKFCHVDVSNRCTVKFVYDYDHDDNVLVEIEDNVECLNGRNYIVFGWCVFIIYMIILMIIFKIL